MRRELVELERAIRQPIHGLDDAGQRGQGDRGPPRRLDEQRAQPVGGPIVNWPFKVEVYEHPDGPLETAPDPGHKTMDPFEFNKAGRPGMTIGKVGKKE